MGKNFNHLTRDKRLKLEAYLKANISKKDISLLLGVHISTIYREIKRGLYEHLNSDYTITTKYSCDKADIIYRENLKAKGSDLKINKDFELSRYIEKRIIKDKLSPGAVLGEIKHKQLKFKTSICKTTLYSYIKKDIFENLTIKHLLIKSKEKTKKKKIIQKKMIKGTSIEQRPKEIDSRITFGHWEMDCVCGSSKSTLLVFTERLTRKEIIRKMDNQKSESVIKELDKLERYFGCKRFKEIFKTITTDNGSEFLDFNKLEKSIYTKKARTKIYYCHAYCSSEKGTCERLNREIRRLIPKGSDISQYDKDYIQLVENWINNYPREIFNYATSNDIWNQYYN